MKRIIPIFIALIVLTGCSQNNGHIGPIYGAWTLLEVTCDGQKLEVEGEATIFSFQGEILQITHFISSADDFTKNFGNFAVNNNVLTLKFEAGISGDSGYQYTAPAWLYFPPDGLPVEFRIIELDTKRLVFERTDAQGKVYHYDFKKTW